MRSLLLLVLLLLPLHSLAAEEPSSLAEEKSEETSQVLFRLALVTSDKPAEVVARFSKRGAFSYEAVRSSEERGEFTVRSSPSVTTVFGRAATVRDGIVGGPVTEFQLVARRAGDNMGIHVECQEGERGWSFDVTGPPTGSNHAFSLEGSEGTVLLFSVQPVE